MKLIIQNIQNGSFLYNQMKYKIDKKSETPGYMQLYAELRADIVGGAYEYGSRLPSKRLLAEETETSVITVEHAYAILCDEGYAEARERRGYFVIYRERDFFATAASFPDRSTRAAPRGAPRGGEAPPSRADGEQFPFSVLARTMRRVILDRGERLLVGSPSTGCPELRGAISAYLRRSCGIDASPEQIVIGSGAEYLYSLIAQLLGSDRVFALEEPSYPKIKQVYEASGIRCESLALTQNGIDSAALRDSKASVLHITPFHSYPSGVTADATKRREYIRWAKERGGYIIEDNYDSELTVSKKNDDTVFSLDDGGSVIYLNTFSHTVARSIRAGYMVLSPTLEREFEDKLGFYSCTVPVFEQYLLAELIESGDFERHINRVRRKRRRESR